MVKLLEVHEKPKKNVPLPKKGMILKEKFTVHTWGTIRPELNQ